MEPLRENSILSTNPPDRPQRGISPTLLLEQVRNTVPYLFEEAPTRAQPHVALLRETALRLKRCAELNVDLELNHYQYFRLCLAAHHATVASFVPTDVDNQIRVKLWLPNLTTDVLEMMADAVMESLRWDYRAVSTRWLAAPASGQLLSGHLGEWFSTAVAAYSALRRRSPEMAFELARLITSQVQLQQDIYAEFKAARDGIGLLKAATLIAHNLGDLDRVVEAWNLPEGDPLREAVYKAGHTGATAGTFALLKEAGDLNKAYTADENHRHFALREPRCLRKSPDFLLPIGPFFDDWGARLAKHPGLSPEELGQVVEALVNGWERLRKNSDTGPVGYSRAIAGLLENFPGGFQELSKHLPARIARELKAGPLRAQISIPKQRFQDQWAQMALKFLRHAS